MLFSIATPTFNCLSQLKSCVGSVRRQQGVEVEHLVQDGGSTDGTPAWLAAQTGLKAVSERDAGMYDAINRAWARGRGDVFAWLNADEQYLPGTLAHVASVFDQHPEIDMLFGDTLIVNHDGRLLAARREIPLRAWYVKNGFLYALSCSLFFRSRLVEKGWLKFDTSYRLAGDFDLMLRLLAQGARCRHVSRYYALFGITGDNLSMNPRMEQEGEEIKRRNHALQPRALRVIPRAGRAIERVLRGCYLPDRVTYDFVLDETGAHRSYENVLAHFRFSWKNVERTTPAP